MHEHRVFKRLSRRAQDALSRSEGLDVEFKGTASGLSADDLVAFANSDQGGVILLGVEEHKNSGRPSTAKIVGCDVSDRTKQAVLSRAESCTPPIEVNVFVENTSAAPFLRLEIPTGRERPYCTSGGTYKIRGDARNKPLPPGLLLSMFVEKESHQFLTRFRDATEDLESKVRELMESVLWQLNSLDQSTERFAESIEGTLGDIGLYAETAQGESEVASSLSAEIHEWVEGIAGNVNSYGRDIMLKLDSLLKDRGIPDPTLDRDVGLKGMQIWQMILEGLTLDQALERLAQSYPASTEEQLEQVRQNAIEFEQNIKRKSEKSQNRSPASTKCGRKKER